MILCAIFVAGVAVASYAGGLNNSAETSELKVTLLDYASIGDHGLTYEGHSGALRMAEKLPYVNLSERENAVPNASQIMREYADNGYKLIFCHSLAFGSAVAEVAPDYPDVVFMWCGGPVKHAPNVGIYAARYWDAEYLTGVLAGCMTKTSKIAFVAPGTEI
jgi:basic membrane lipoprotein Med (substrate-binding protein (PBP1-ABC) superfamily)